MVFNFIVIPIIFLIVMIYLTLQSYSRKQLSKVGMIFWMVIWIGGILLVFFHQYADRVLAPLNITRVFDLYTIIAFLVLLFIVFYLFGQVQRDSKRIESLTRTIALKGLKK